MKKIKIKNKKPNKTPLFAGLYNAGHQKASPLYSHVQEMSLSPKGRDKSALQTQTRKPTGHFQTRSSQAIRLQTNSSKWLLRRETKTF